MNSPVQLYRYNCDEMILLKESEKYFAQNFNPTNELHLTQWLNFNSMVEKDQIIKICNRLEIDKLIQEDLFSGTKRSRLEEYPNYIFFSIISALPSNDHSSYNLQKERLSFIMGDTFLISFQEKSSDHFPIVRERIEKNRGKIRYKGPDFLLFRLLEAIIDNYNEVVDRAGENIETLDKVVLRNPSSELLRRVEWEKRKILELRKVVLPMKELLLQFDRVENKLIIEENCHYFKELRDTCFSITEEIEAQKSMLDGISNLYYAVQGQKMNEIMKVLTVTSAIFIPLTFIVGVYGMNFENMPELHLKNGYYIVVGLMALIGFGLLVVFTKRGWLKRDDK